MKTMKCNNGETPAFNLTRQTTWDTTSVTFPFSLAGFTAQIDFKEYGGNTVLLSIDSIDTMGSHIVIDLDTNTVYPVVSAADSELFILGKIYNFDIALKDVAGEVKRSGIILLNIQPSVTDVL